MENASRALIMAAGVLIGILILSLAIYLIVSFGGVSAEIHEQNSVKQIATFNSRFTAYVGKDITIYDVITIANLATENNKYYEFNKRTELARGNDNYISVRFSNRLIEYGLNDDSEVIKRRYNDLINADLAKISVDKNSVENDYAKYNVSVEISPETSRVYRIIIN